VWIEYPKVQKGPKVKKKRDAEGEKNRRTYHPRIVKEVFQKIEKRTKCGAKEGKT